jgi:hypothetical protein
MVAIVPWAITELEINAVINKKEDEIINLQMEARKQGFINWSLLKE